MKYLLQHSDSIVETLKKIIILVAMMLFLNLLSGLWSPAKAQTLNIVGTAAQNMQKWTRADPLRANRYEVLKRKRDALPYSAQRARGTLTGQMNSLWRSGKQDVAAFAAVDPATKMDRWLKSDSAKAQKYLYYQKLLNAPGAVRMTNAEKKRILGEMNKLAIGSPMAKKALAPDEKRALLQQIRQLRSQLDVAKTSSPPRVVNDIQARLDNAKLTLDELTAKAQKVQKNTTSSGNIVKIDSCITCQFAQDLITFTNDFAKRGANLLSGGISAFANSLALLVLSWWGIKTMIMRDHSILSKPLINFALICLVVVSFLNDPTLIFRWFLWPVQDFTVGLSELIMTEFNPLGSEIQPPDSYETYARIIWFVEQMASWVVFLAIKIIQDTSFWPTDVVQRLFAGLLLAAPWFFILMMQALFMVEAAFMFALFGIMSPLLLAVYITPVGRPYLPAFSRVLLSKALTVFFAAIVISFTGFAVQKHQVKVRALIDPGNSAIVQQMVGEQKIACSSTTNSSYDSELCQQAKDRVLSAQNPEFKLFDTYFMTLLAIGFISLFFHLQTKSWASNLAGAQDGAGGAAAVAGIVTGAAGVGLTMATGIFSGGAGIAAKVAGSTAAKTAGSAAGSAAGSVANNLMPGGGNDSNGLRGNSTHSPVNMSTGPTPPPSGGTENIKDILK